MISRIYIIPKIKDSRERLFLNSWNSLNIKGKVNAVTIVDSYLVDGDISVDQILKSAKFLTNPILENFAINEIVNGVDTFDFAIETGFLPGVTDNVGNTARETIIDCLHLSKDSNIKVYDNNINEQ